VDGESTVKRELAVVSTIFDSERRNRQVLPYAFTSQSQMRNESKKVAFFRVESQESTENVGTRKVGDKMPFP
jgi:hypothetical protein